MLEEIDFVWDPIHGYIGLTRVEKDLLNSFPYQRLRRLNPTPSSSFVYPSMTGNRLSHSLGVLHLAGKLAERLTHKLEPNYNLEKKEQIIQNIRIAALTHDIGHGPFSHTFDFFLKKNNLKLTHEEIGFYILCQENKFKEILNREQLDPIEIGYIAWGEDKVKNCLEDFELNGEIEEIGKDVKALYDIVHGAPHCADIIDFLLRDSHYAGLNYGNIDIERLIKFIEIFEGKLGINRKAFLAYENMLLARYYMFQSVYWHRTARSIDYLLLDSLDAVNKYLDLTGKVGLLKIVQGIKDKNENSIFEYLQLDDGYIFSIIKEIFFKDSLKENLGDEGKNLKKTAERLLLRQPAKMVANRFIPDLLKKVKDIHFDLDDFKEQHNKRFLEAIREDEIDENMCFLDIPALIMIPMHAHPAEVRDIPFFEEINGGKNSWEIPKDSILDRIYSYLGEIRIYSYDEKLEDKLKEIAKQLWDSERFESSVTQA